MSEDPSSEPSPSEKIQSYKKLLQEHESEIKSYRALWKIFTENALLPDFHRSKWAAMSLITFPLLTNFFFYYRPSMMFKNTIRITVFLGCFIHFSRSLNKDFDALVKKDTPISNLARFHIQNLARYDLDIKDYAKETLEIVAKRKEAESTQHNSTLSNEKKL